MKTKTRQYLLLIIPVLSFIGMFFFVEDIFDGKWGTFGCLACFIVFIESIRHADESGAFEEKKLKK